LMESFHMLSSLIAKIYIFYKYEHFYCNGYSLKKIGLKIILSPAWWHSKIKCIKWDQSLILLLHDGNAFTPIVKYKTYVFVNFNYFLPPIKLYILFYFILFFYVFSYGIFFLIYRLIWGKKTERWSLNKKLCLSNMGASELV
jgi:hypothetical protein